MATLFDTLGYPGKSPCDLKQSKLTASQQREASHV